MPSVVGLLDMTLAATQNLGDDGEGGSVLLLFLFRDDRDSRSAFLIFKALNQRACLRPQAAGLRRFLVDCQRGLLAEEVGPTW